LDEEFGFNTTKINSKIALSDIISAIEGLPSVDRVEIEKIKVQPYARPQDDTNSILNIEFQDLPITTIPYKILYCV
jgi:hypothetical protein